MPELTDFVVQARELPAKQRQRQAPGGQLLVVEVPQDERVPELAPAVGQQALQHQAHWGPKSGYPSVFLESFP